MKPIFKTINGIGYYFPADVWNNYFTQFVIRHVGDNECIFEVYDIGKFQLHISIQKAIEMTNNQDEKLLELLFNAETPFPIRKFLSIRPPETYRYVYEPISIFQKIIKSIFI